MKTIHARVPDRLFDQIDRLVKEGWFLNHQDIVRQALQRFVESHRPELMEKFIMDDVKWALTHAKTNKPIDTLEGLLENVVPPNADVEGDLREMNEQWIKSLEL